MIPSIKAACVFCGATKDYEGKLMQDAANHTPFSKNVRSQCKVWDFPAPGTPCKIARNGFGSILLVSPFLDSFGVAPFHNGCKNLLLLLVGGWRQPRAGSKLATTSGPRPT